MHDTGAVGIVEIEAVNKRAVGEQGIAQREPRALPDDGWSARGDGSGEPPLQGVWESAGLVRHTFTHFALELSVQIQRDAPAVGGSGEWWPLDRLDEAGLPTLFAKAARLALAD